MKKTWENYYRLLEAYYKEHGNLNFPKNYTVVVSGIAFNLSEFVNGQRKSFRKMMGMLDSDKVATMTPTRKELLDRLSMDWDPMETSWKKYYSILKQYYEEYGNIYICEQAKIKVGEQEVAIGKFLERQRRAYRKRSGENLSNVSPMSDEHLELLEKLGMIWDPLEVVWQRNYQLFKEYYQTYGDLEIPYHYKAEVNGEVVNLGVALSGQRKAYRKRVGESDADTYAPMSDEHLELLEKIDFVDSIKQRRYAYDFGDGTKYYSKLALSNHIGISVHMFNDYFQKFNHDVEKTVTFCQLNKQSRLDKKRRNATDEKLLEIDINLEQMSFQPNRQKDKSNCKIPVVEGKTLRDFCIENGYNYSVILRKLKNKLIRSPLQPADKLLDEAITEYKKAGQKRPTSWIYGKYDNAILFHHFCLSLKLDTMRVLSDIKNYSLTTEQAIEVECFRQKSQSNYDYLSPLFQQFITSLKSRKIEFQVDEKRDAFLSNMKEQYHLSCEEYEVFESAFLKYQTTIRQFYIHDVAFESTQQGKEEKILKYQLTKDEIQESCLLPLVFEENVFLEVEEERKQRHLLLKQLVSCWGSFSEEERIEQQKLCQLTVDELVYIDVTREQINQLQQHAKSYSKKNQS